MSSGAFVEWWRFFDAATSPRALPLLRQLLGSESNARAVQEAAKDFLARFQALEGFPPLIGIRSRRILRGTIDKLTRELGATQVRQLQQLVTRPAGRIWGQQQVIMALDRWLYRGGSPPPVTDQDLAVLRKTGLSLIDSGLWTDEEDEDSSGILASDLNTNAYQGDDTEDDRSRVPEQDSVAFLNELLLLRAYDELTDAISPEARCLLAGWSKHR